jgi:large subunit ribosomal protein L3
VVVFLQKKLPIGAAFIGLCIKNPGKNRIFFYKMSFILGKKMNMTQIWKDGKVVPVTVVKAEPNKVSIVRSKERDGYEAVQVVLGKTKREFRNRLSQPIDMATLEKDASVTVEVFKEGDKVRVSGLTKGRGFQGVVKRHGFGGGPKTHGQKNRHRAPGSIGSTAFQRVVPGRRMAGHMGTERVTIKNLVVAAIDKDNNLLFLRGAVPGAKGGLLEIATGRPSKAAAK